MDDRKRLASLVASNGDFSGVYRGATNFIVTVHVSRSSCKHVTLRTYGLKKYEDDMKRIIEFYLLAYVCLKCLNVVYLWQDPFRKRSTRLQ
jgi:hypothetical protein